jgi:hypothetical protein
MNNIINLYGKNLMLDEINDNNRYTYLQTVKVPIDYNYNQSKWISINNPLDNE